MIPSQMSINLGYGDRFENLQENGPDNATMEVAGNMLSAEMYEKKPPKVNKERAAMLQQNWLHTMSWLFGADKLTEAPGRQQPPMLLPLYHISYVPLQYWQPANTTTAAFLPKEACREGVWPDNGSCEGLQDLLLTVSFISEIGVSIWPSAFDVMVVLTRSSLPWVPHTWMSWTNPLQTPRAWFWGTHKRAISTALLTDGVNTIVGNVLVFGLPLHRGIERRLHLTNGRKMTKKPKFAEHLWLQ